MNQQNDFEKKLARGITIQMTISYDEATANESRINLKLHFESEHDKMLLKQLMSSVNLSMYAPREAESASLTYSSLNDMIVRWHPARNQLKKAELISDIMEKVESQVAGVTYYECYSSKYKLEISEWGSYLYDLFLNKTYCFVR